MAWRQQSFFERAFGFPEDGYDATRKRLLEHASITEAADGTIARSIPTLPAVAERCLFDFPNGNFDAGTFSEPSVAELRAVLDNRLQNQVVKDKVAAALRDKGLKVGSKPVTIRCSNTVGESRAMHSEQTNAVFQAASQFNYLEFPSPNTSPEHGIGGYAFDRTQGPACAIACAAGTAYRNYLLAPLKSAHPQKAVRGQQSQNQRNGLADLEKAFADILASQPDLLPVGQSGELRRQPSGSDADLAIPTGGETFFVPLNSRDSADQSEVNERGSPLSRQTTLPIVTSSPALSSGGVRLPWRVKNGYIEADPSRLPSTHANLRNPTIRDILRDKLRIGLQENTCVIGADYKPMHRVTQVYCSAVSCGYSRCSTRDWQPLALLVLEALYEATVLIAAVKAVDALAHNQQPPVLFLTKVGGGVFGNEASWIKLAIQRAVAAVAKFGVPLEVKIVHFGSVEEAYDDKTVQAWSQ